MTRRKKITVNCRKCGLPVWRLEKPNGDMLLVDTAPDPDGTVRLIRRQVDGFGTTELLCEVLPPSAIPAAAMAGEALYMPHAANCAATPLRKPNPMPQEVRALLESRGHLSPVQEALK